MMQNPLLQPGLNGAFVADGFGELPVAIDRRGDALNGVRLAVKDVFDIEGLRAGAGNPTWGSQQPLAPKTALAVRAVMEAGARWVGKAVTDELTYSLAGVNAHFGTPANPADPMRLPGGSSSGSAVAVAAHHADVALGTDCGGSVRLPASYCGIWGMRPTHGRIAVDGCLTLAHSFDTAGWFARDAAHLIRVFEVLSQSIVPHAHGALALRVPQEMLACADDAVSERFSSMLLGCAALSDVETFALDAALDDWAQAFRLLQGAEIAQRYGAWSRAHGASFGPDVGRRFASSLQITDAQIAHSQRVRCEAISLVSQTLKPGTYWLAPTVPGAAPRVDAPAETVERARSRAQQMLCIAGLASLPQVSLPWTSFDGAPVGLSVIGARGDDEGVLQTARDLHAALASTAR